MADSGHHQSLGHDVTTISSDEEVRSGNTMIRSVSALQHALTHGTNPVWD